MKYIRTKDRIIEKQEKEQVYNGLHYFYTYDININDYEYKEEDVIKQADTIEELCDEFVLINKKDKTHFIDALPPDVYDYKDYQIYGAIWTDKGLIYVAKMNEKGELELL